MNSGQPGDASDRFEFNFVMPPAGAVPITLEEAERRLLEALEKGVQAGNPVPALWDLANFYKIQGQVEKARQLVHELLLKVPDLESKASLIMSLGQLAEKTKDFELAVRFYSEGVGMEPCSQLTWYYLHNNLGYSLIQLGRFAEGEAYCRRAIEISPITCNGHKNLGLALQAQGRYAEAAQCFVTATQANASDARSTAHLEELLKDHPELQFDFGPLLAKCQAAVDLVRKEIAKRAVASRKPAP